MRDLGILIAVATGLGVVHLAIRGASLPWIAPPRDEEEVCHPVGPLHLVQRMPVSEARALVGQPGVTFVDAREHTAWTLARIPGAINLPATDAAGILEIQSVPIPPADLVITYCDGLACEQSEYLGLLLRDRAGCERVQVLEGGWSGWLAHQGQVESGSSLTAEGTRP